MKKILTLTIIGLIILSCTENNENRDNCDFQAILNTEQYHNTPTQNQVIINNLKIIGNCLKINFSISGCQVNIWEAKLVSINAVLDSAILQRNLKLYIKTDGSCNTLITKELSFDISNLQVDDNKVLLNIVNTQKQILYEY